MAIKIDEDNLKEGLLGLVVALVEIVEEVLERQAVRRMESGRLSDEEIERLGSALSDLNEALEKIKQDNNIVDSVRTVKEGLDQIADDVVDQFLNPERWAQDEGDGKVSLFRGQDKR
ncbi:MAG TPA: gas vesicle protein K [Methanotrichaceae archaeon]|nr:gas vesicle protein K [Methanotrichaceae archaeon]